MSKASQARRKERRNEREPAHKAAEQTQASRRGLLARMGPVALAALAVAAAGVLIVTRARDVAGSPGQPSSAHVEEEASALLNGIPQNGNTLGQPTAPFTLQVFGDLESADVRTFMVWLLPDIIREWVRTNILKIQFRAFMTASASYPNIFLRQQASALSAGVQGKLWNFIETFYREQGQERTRYVTEAYLNRIAEQVPGLDLGEWESDRESSQLIKQVIEDDDVARRIGFPDAPVFAIGRSSGKLVPWPGYRLYEEPGLEPGHIKRPLHPVSFITSRTLRAVIEHLL